MKEEFLIKHSRTWDRLGIFTSGLCLIHCILTPIVFAFYPMISDHVFFEESFHLIVLVSVVAIAAMSFISSYRKHRNKNPLILGFIGIGFLSLNESLFGIFGHNSHFLLTGIGGALLIAGHAWNIHICHCFCDRSCHHEAHQSG